MTTKHNKKTKQHIVPVTYLKHWKISHDESFVFGIDFKNKYNKRIQKLGLKNKIFTEKNFYNDSYFEDPYAIEDLLGENIEPIYDKIMKEVFEERNLSQDIIGEIIAWLHYSYIRCSSIRENLEEKLNYMTVLVSKLNGLKEAKIGYEKFNKKFARDSHLGLFRDTERSKGIAILLFKQWRILKSDPLLEFWTNDSPGFSPNLIQKFASDGPYHSIMQMNPESIVYYPLSPKYCLEIKPYDESILASNKEQIVKYEQASFELIEYINKGTLFTTNKVLVSKSKKSLELCVKMFQQEQFLKQYFKVNELSMEFLMGKLN